MNFIKSGIASFAILLIGKSVLAVDPIEFSPYYLTPDPAGFYKTGSYKYETDAEGNKTDSTLYYGCSTETNDSDHWETDTQQNYVYQNTVIMPECWPLDADQETGDGSLVDQGYIQLGKTKYTGTDSANLCYIISPKIQNLDSISVQISPDATPQKTRKIGLNIEYSLDNGSTWSGSNDEDVYIQIDATSKYGETHHMSTSNSNMVNEFGDFVTASESGILIRFMSIDVSTSTTYTQGSQRCKVHNIKIYAEEATTTTAIENASVIDQTTITINDHTISTKDGSQIAVFNYLGQTMGIGTSVSVQTGIYIVRTEDGQAQKVLVK